MGRSSGRLARKDIVRERREAMGLTPGQLAAKAELSLRTISKAEAGGRCNLDTLKRLAEALDSSIADISYREDRPSEPTAPGVLVLADQARAEGEAIARLKGMARLEGRTFETATLVDFTPHVDREFYSALRDEPPDGLGIQRIELIFGSVAQAIRLESQRQAHLLYHGLEDLSSDFEPTTVVHHNLPTSFRGFRIGDEVVCLGWSVWLPSFSDCDEEDRPNGLIKKLNRKYNMNMTAVTDRLAMNGARMPHVLAFNGGPGADPSPYNILSAMFDDYVEAVLRYWDLHCGRDGDPPQATHPDFIAFKVENPRPGVKRIDPRSERFWTGGREGRAGGGTQARRGSKPGRNKN
jgi:transcriptional regulator with XRE-family HTH domain